MATTENKWVVKGVSKSVREQVNAIAKSEKTVNGKVIQRLLEETACCSQAKFNASEIKNISDIRKSLILLDKRLAKIEQPVASNFKDFESAPSRIPKVNVGTHLFEGLLDKGRDVWSSIIGFVSRK